jgi:5'-3' exonuclease
MLKGSNLELDDIASNINTFIGKTISRYGINPSKCELVFDSKNNWRYSLYPEYKANRETKRKDPRIKEAFAHFNENRDVLEFPKFEHDYMEADDIIAERVRYHMSRNQSCVIWSTDKDLNQLIAIDLDNECFVAQYGGYNLSPTLYLHHKMNEFQDTLYRRGIDEMADYSYKLYQIKQMEKACTVKYINPDEIVFSKVISGDRSDNVQSVWRSENGRGIGDVTVFKMWNAWNDIHSDKELKWNSKDFHDELAMFILEYMKQEITPDNVSKLSNNIRTNIKLTRLNNRYMPKSILESYRNTYPHVI